VIGNPIVPVIKLCANPRTVRLMSEHIDVDCSALLQRELTLDQAGDRLLESMLRTANGRLTAAEALGHREFVMTTALRKRLKTRRESRATASCHSEWNEEFHPLRSAMRMGFLVASLVGMTRI